jgi:hypothetical protein
MSPDEVFVALICGIVTLVGWGRWYTRLLRLPAMGRPPAIRPVLSGLPAAALLGILLVLRRMASADVRFDPIYLLFYLLFGATWLWAVCSVAQRLGISWVDDAMDRGNLAAVLAVSGIVLGGAACYAGGNVGDGPGWWCVLIAGGLATAFWFLLWYALERLTRVSEVVTVERDAGAGTRLGAWLLASGLICGRAAAGDWVGLVPTIADFAVTVWPALPLAALAAVVEWRRSRRPFAPAGAAGAKDAWLLPSLGIALVYLAVAAAVLLLPLWSQGPAYGLPPAEAM